MIYIYALKVVSRIICAVYITPISRNAHHQDGPLTEGCVPQRMFLRLALK